MSEQGNHSATGATGFMRFAPTPASTRLESGNAAVRAYKKSWVGDGSDALVPDSVKAFSHIDMAVWVVESLKAADALFAPAMAAAITKLYPERAASLTAQKQRLAEVIAQTLIPVLVVPGQVPEVEPARAVFRKALLEGFGAAYGAWAGDGGPLSVYPPLPEIIGLRADTAPSPISIAEALLWDFGVTFATQHAAQDELILSVVINGSSAPAQPAGTAPPRRAAAATLFEALARLTFEYPQIAPHLLEVRIGGNATVAGAALERLDALIGDVILTWPNWFGRAMPTATRDRSAAAVDQVTWTYRVDFGRRPVLRVTRVPIGDGLLPPWPEIAGFITPAEDGQATDSFQASPNAVAGAPLSFTWTGLPIVQAQTVTIAASVSRNSNLVPPGSPDGTLVDPAFLYRTPVVRSVAVSPFSDLPSQPFLIGGDAANLSDALAELLKPLLAAPTLAGLSIRDFKIGIAAFSRVSPGADGARVFSEIPILNGKSVAAPAPAEDQGWLMSVFRPSVIDAITAWHAAIEPNETPAAIRFAITLSAAGAQISSPLAYLGQVEAPVPIGRVDWWR